MKYTELITQPPPDILYHYTSPEGLIGILRSRSVWATEVHYLNDSQEFREAFKVARAILLRLTKSDQEEEIRTFLLHLRGLLDSIERIRICVFSLTKEGDQLGQWRGYCPPTGGYSIGFAPDRIQSIAQQHGFVLAPCVYDSKSQRDLISELIDETMRINTSNNRIVGDSESSDLEEVLSHFFSRFSEIAPLIKHRSFSEEKEWRLVSKPVVSNHEYLRHRLGQTMLIPYYDLPLEASGHPLKLKEIVVGPTAHKDLAIDSLSSLLSCTGIRCSVQRSSNVPYRLV